MGNRFPVLIVGLRWLPRATGQATDSGQFTTYAIRLQNTILGE